MRETWLGENQRLVSQDNFGFDLAAVEAATKKHEAIETDINAYEERVQAVVSVANDLEQENYHDIDRINTRYVKRRSFMTLYYTLRFYFPYLSLLAQLVTIFVYGPARYLHYFR